MTHKILVQILRVIVCVLVILTCSCTTPTPSNPIRPSIPDELPLTINVGQEPIFVNLRLETGEILPFLLDTGSATTTLNKSLEAKLGQRLGSHQIAYGWKTFGKPTCGIYAAPKLFLGNVQLQTGRRVDTDDLTRIWPGRPMMGILGMDCLHNYCLQLDFKAGKMRFLDPDHLSLENPGRAFPLTFSGGDVFTRMDFFDKKNVWFMLDTADYHDGALTANLFSLALQKQNDVWIDQWKETNGVTVRMAYLSKCTIKSENYTNLIFNDCSMGAVRSQNILGLNFLARNLATFNFPKQMMYLKQTSVGPLTKWNP